MNNNTTNISNFDDDLTASTSLSSISSANLVYSTTSGGWNTIGQPVFNIEDLKDMFIVMMKDLSEDQIIPILDSIKERQPSNYNHCLINLVAYPNLKLMSEQFLIERYEDLKKATSNTHKNIDFSMTYGKLLDQMPAFKLLIELKK
jgi:hypothetical protein